MAKKLKTRRGLGVSVATHLGPRTLRAIDRTAYWAITPCLESGKSRRYTVTHIPTGCGHLSALTLSAARKVLRDLTNSNADWSFTSIDHISAGAKRAYLSVALLHSEATDRRRPIWSRMIRDLSRLLPEGQ